MQLHLLNIDSVSEYQPIYVRYADIYLPSGLMMLCKVTFVSEIEKITDIYWHSRVYSTNLDGKFELALNRLN